MVMTYLIIKCTGLNVAAEFEFQKVESHKRSLVGIK